MFEWAWRHGGMAVPWCRGDGRVEMEMESANSIRSEAQDLPNKHEQGNRETSGNLQIVPRRYKSQIHTTWIAHDSTS
jgi:hypothetical protein